MTRYIGIDPGLHCGYAVLDDRGHWITSGVWDLRPSRAEGGGMIWLRLEAYLTELLGPRPVDNRIAYEAVLRHLGADAAHMYGGIIATIQRTCETLQTPYCGIHYATIKRAGTGRGNANKEQMITAARKQWPHVAVADDNEADALWCAEALRRQLGHRLGLGISASLTNPFAEERKTAP